jgi:predicted amino acid racemase
VQPARAMLTIDLGKIADNARVVVGALPGIDVVAVTKVTCGSPAVARAMLAGGAIALGESRLENAERLRAAGIDVPIWLLRAPTPELADEAVRLSDVSLATEWVGVQALDRACARLGRDHAIVAMVDLGDLREGMLPDELPGFVERVSNLAHLRLVGVGVSLTCYGGVVPSTANLEELVDLAKRAEEISGRPLFVSGGMSSSLELAIAGEMPEGVGNLRVGESILLGVSTLTRKPIMDLHSDAFVLHAPVIECRRKPSVPRGELAQDAFGRVPAFEDRGERMRALCALGRQDAPPEGLRPLDHRVRILGASSDHLILDVDDLPTPPAIGEAVGFVPNYAATLRLNTSPYVEKRYVEDVAGSETSSTDARPIAPC